MKFASYHPIAMAFAYSISYEKQSQNIQELCVHMSSAYSPWRQATWGAECGGQTLDRMEESGAVGMGSV